MDNRAIGVFDSGLGGLTVVKELHRLLPGEDIVYLGDTGRIPYGSRSRETIIKYASQDIDFLLKKDIKMIVAACGTVSSNFPKAMADQLPVPYLDVILPTAQTACVPQGAHRGHRYGGLHAQQRVRQGHPKHPLRRAGLRQCLPAAGAPGGKRAGAAG